MMTALKEYYSTQQEADALTTSWNLMQVWQYSVTFPLFILIYSHCLSCAGTTIMLRRQQLY